MPTAATPACASTICYSARPARSAWCMQTWIGTCAAGKKRATTRRHGSSSWTSRSGPELVRAQPQRGGSEQALTSSIGQREPVDRPRFVRPTVTLATPKDMGAPLAHQDDVGQ
jgi:hypothetical protein